MSSQGDQETPPPRRRLKKKIHRKRELRVRTASIRSDINVTPLVDVVLVLLIIFMVVTPMITRGMPAEQPETRYHDKKNDSGEQIVVSVTCEGGKMGAIHWECGSSRVYVASEPATDETIAFTSADRDGGLLSHASMPASMHAARTSSVAAAVTPTMRTRLAPLARSRARMARVRAGPSISGIE